MIAFWSENRSILAAEPLTKAVATVVVADDVAAIVVAEVDEVATFAEKKPLVKSCTCCRYY